MFFITLEGTPGTDWTYGHKLHFRGPTILDAQHFTLNWKGLNCSKNCIRWEAWGSQLPRGAQIVHGPRAQPCLNPALICCLISKLFHLNIIHQIFLVLIALQVLLIASHWSHLTDIVFGVFKMAPKSTSLWFIRPKLSICYGVKPTLVSPTFAMWSIWPRP